MHISGLFSTPWYRRLATRHVVTSRRFRELPIQMFIKVASPRLSGIGMPSLILWSHPLKMQRIVLQSSLLWWELGTSSLITGPGEWLSFRRFTSKLSWSWQGYNVDASHILFSMTINSFIILHIFSLNEMLTLTLTDSFLLNEDLSQITGFSVTFLFFPEVRTMCFRRLCLFGKHGMCNRTFRHQVFELSSITLLYSHPIPSLARWATSMASRWVYSLWALKRRAVSGSG